MHRATSRIFGTPDSPNTVDVADAARLQCVQRRYTHNDGTAMWPQATMPAAVPFRSASASNNAATAGGGGAARHTSAPSPSPADGFLDGDDDAAAATSAGWAASQLRPATAAAARRHGATADK